MRKNKKFKKKGSHIITAPGWKESEEGIINFFIKNDGMNGFDWLARLMKHGCHIDKYVKKILLSDYFKADERRNLKVTVFKGTYFQEREYTNETIIAEAESRGLSLPNMELACLIRERFTDADFIEMGFSSITVMHKQIKDCDGDLVRLSPSASSWSSSIFTTRQSGPIYDHFSSYAFVEDDNQR